MHEIKKREDFSLGKCDNRNGCNGVPSGFSLPRYAERVLN
jgi:hypothetical protein